jgi:outer membrane protein assembly factor BamB
MTDGRDRRSVLRAGVALCSVGLAGCVLGIGDGDDDGGSNGTDTSGPDDPEPPEPDPVTSWPMQQFDAQNTAAVPDAEAPTYDIEEQWQTELEEQIRSSPVVADDVLFVRDGGGTVHAIDSEGSEQWTASVPEGDLETTPAIYEDILLVPHDSGIVAFDRNDGTERWECPSESGTSDLTVADDAVFFTDTQSSVYALEAGTGDLRWLNSADETQGRHAHTPAVENGTVYAPTESSYQSEYQEISTFDVDSGDSQTLYQTGSYGFVAGVTLANGGVFAPTTDGIRAYDQDGPSLWHFPTEKPLEGGLAVAGDMVYGISTADSNEKLYAIDVKEGSEQWSAEVETIYGQGPIVVGDYLIYANPFWKITSFDRFTGERYWVLDTPPTWFEWGAFSNGQLYFADLEGRILAYGEP